MKTQHSQKLKKKNLIKKNAFATLCDPIDGSPPGLAVHGILQARILEWVAMTSSDPIDGSPPGLAVPVILQARMLEWVATSSSIA